MNQMHVFDTSHNIDALHKTPDDAEIRELVFIKLDRVFTAKIIKEFDSMPSMEPLKFVCRCLPALLITLLISSAVAQEKAKQAEKNPNQHVKVQGELKKWHKVTLACRGPKTDEQATPNPFRDFRLNVTFRHKVSGKKYHVPGYYAADGDAANTSADSGNQWRVHFAPDETGEWSYKISFRRAKYLATTERPDFGSSAGFCDEASGTFDVAGTDKTGRDFRAHGRLQYVGERYLRFAETGKYFLKAGADAPENLLSYADFDGDFKTDGHKDDLVKTWKPHLKDWQAGDPTWGEGKGKALIGAVNYLSSKGMNVMSFLTMNIIGDDRNVFPYTDYDERERFDVSKLAQWEVVFAHAQQKGLYLHFKTQEAENQSLLDGGGTGVHRKLYYRELIARFGHHLALNWNLGEEIGEWGAHGDGQDAWARRMMTYYFHDHDPYRHLVVIHNGRPFDDLLGDQSKLTGASVQTNKPDFRNVHGAVKKWIDRSAAAGKQWVVACDEPGDAQHSLITDDEDPQHNNARKNALWGALMAGGAGIEWYFGYKHPNSDLSCQDWRSRDKMWDQSRYALQFFVDNEIPFHEMKNDNDLVPGKDDYVFCKPGEVYVVYLKNGGAAKLNLQGATGEFKVRFYNPRTGKFHSQQSTITGGGNAEIGPPPAEPDSDWALLIQR